MRYVALLLVALLAGASAHALPCHGAGTRDVPPAGLLTAVGVGEGELARATPAEACCEVGAACPCCVVRSLPFVPDVAGVHAETAPALALAAEAARTPVPAVLAARGRGSPEPRARPSRAASGPRAPPV